MLDATPAVPPSPEVEAAIAAEAALADEPVEHTPLRKRLRWPFVTAFFVQLMLVLGDRIPSVDSMSYFETGTNYVNGRGYTRSGAPEMHFPPVAPVSFGLLEKLTGNEMFALRTWELFWAMAAVVILTAVAWFISRKDDVVVATAWIAVAVPGVVTLSIRAGSGSELPVVVMLLASGPLANFIGRNPTIVMLALGFLLMIGAMLIADGFGYHLPRGYIYAAMGFSAFVEFLNMAQRRRDRKVDDSE